jgi:hypothetical protein
MVAFLLNDQAIAAQFYWTINSQKDSNYRFRCIGNGTAEILKKPNVFTFSTHGELTTPFKKKLLTVPLMIIHLMMNFLK